MSTPEEIARIEIDRQLLACHREILHPDKLIRVRAALASLLPEYVELASNVGASRKHIQAKAKTTAGQTGVSGTDIKETPIPLCAMEEQQQILDEIEFRFSALNRSVNEIESGIVRASRLRQSILKRAFECKLAARPQRRTRVGAARAHPRRTREAGCHTGRRHGAPRPEAGYRRRVTTCELRPKRLRKRGVSGSVVE